MQTINFRLKCALHGKKVALLLLSGIFFISSQVIAQNQRTINLPDSDDKWLHYGFVIGAHSSNFRIKYSDKFVTPSLDTVQSIMPANKGGFSLGFILNFRIAKYADIRLLPKVSFYEHQLDYTYTNREPHSHLLESTVVEFPLLIKYKSARRGNIRMYMVGGINPSIRASGKKNQDSGEEKLVVDSNNLAVEYGFGIDMYYPLFKFSPEIRFSHGLLNLLGEDKSSYSAGLKAVTTHSVSLYLQFSD